jgi:hypothetical protein
MIYVTRLKPFCQIALWLGVLAMVLNATLTVLTGTPVLRWLPRTVAGTGYYEDSRHRVEKAVEEYRAGRITRENHLAAIVGISNVRQGIDLSVIAKSAGPRWRFLGLGGAGLGIYDVAPYADLIVSSDLRPDVVVLGIGLFQLVDSRPKPGSTTLGIVDYLKRGDLRNTATEIRNSVWVYSRRQDVNLSVQASLLRARISLFDLFGVPISKADADELSPWREMIKSDWPEHFSAATLREEEQFFADLGFFERRTYEASPKGMATLLRLIEQFRNHNAEVILVLMPESSRIHQRIPTEALEIMQSHLRRRFSERPPHVLDYRNSIKDSGFVDLGHLNREGSLEFSRILATDLVDLLPTTPSLTAQK